MNVVPMQGPGKLEGSGNLVTNRGSFVGNGDFTGEHCFQTLPSMPAGHVLYGPLPGSALTFKTTGLFVIDPCSALSTRLTRSGSAPPPPPPLPTTCLSPAVTTPHTQIKTRGMEQKELPETKYSSCLSLF